MHSRGMCCMVDRGGMVHRSGGSCMVGGCGVTAVTTGCMVVTMMTVVTGAVAGDNTHKQSNN
jgi:hypothetical protein